MSDDAGTDATEGDALDVEEPSLTDEPPAKDAPVEDDPEPDAEPEPAPDEQLEDDLEAGLEPSGPDARHGAGNPGRATPARGGGGGTWKPPTPHQTRTGGGGGGGGGGGASTGRGGGWLTVNFTRIKNRTNNILSNNSATGVATGGGRKRPAPRKRPTTRTVGARR